MANLINEISPMVTQVFSWTGDVADTIVAHPLLLLTTAFLVIGGCIGIFGRLLSKN